MNNSSSRAPLYATEAEFFLNRIQIFTSMSHKENGSSMEKMQSIKDHLQNTGKLDTQWMNAFQKFMQASKREGALSTKMKEIIGVALSVKGQCNRCIVWHVKKALENGATKQEIVEAAEVAVIMSGGPGIMYMQDVIKAIDEFQNNE